MTKSITTIPVADWVNDQIDKHRAKYPGQKFFSQGSGVHSTNHNADTVVEEDVELYNVTGETVIIRAGWPVTFFCEYTRHASGKTVATIFGPDEQVTIRGNAKFNIKALSTQRPRQR